MKLELNLWFSLKTGNVFGNLNINQKTEIQNIDKLLPISVFCEYVYKKKLMTEDEISALINDDNFDPEAKYAITKKGTIVYWNKNKDFAGVIIAGNEIKLPFGAKRKDYKGMPDVYFRTEL